MVRIIAVEGRSTKYNSNAPLSAVYGGENDDYGIRAGFIAADMFHRNFYNYFMYEHDIEDNRPIVR